MVVVVIIGILAAIAVPSYQGFQDRAKAAEAKVVLGAIYSAEAAFKAEWNSYTGDLEAAGLATQTLDHYEAIGFGVANTVTAGGSSTTGKYVFLKATGLVATTAQLHADCTVGGSTTSTSFKACAQRTAGTAFVTTTDWWIDESRNLEKTAL